ncbi:leucyl/phenylalanyl-tRNA--protein transferase [Spirochaetota bacterium]|nr:leucyl/phenylalanyl-tRNA--protein transferase [Spirochaetota bacterium]
MRRIPLAVLYSELSLTKNNFSPDMPSDQFGLVALGGDLSVDILIEAYSKGVFPWYDELPIKWYSPSERLVLYPDHFYATRTFKKWCLHEGRKLIYSADSAFSQVIYNCAQATRKGQDGGTWIKDEMISAYKELHNLGIAHSVEIWNKKPEYRSTQHDLIQKASMTDSNRRAIAVSPAECDLIGGLYGVSLGRMFFGESMFSTHTNASKLALWLLCHFLKRLQFTMIDCQVANDHLMSLGASVLVKRDFLSALDKSNRYPTLKGSWARLWEAELGTELSPALMPM